MNQQLLDAYGVNNKLTFGSSGFVYLVDTMGDDEAVCQAARISYGAGTKGVSSDRELIRYLVRNHHTTPLEMCEIKLHLRLPMDAWRQMVRHRTANINEYSTRYSVAIDAMATTLPGEWRLQSSSSKQGSAGFLTEWPSGFDPVGMSQYYETPGHYLSVREKDLQSLANEIYQERLAFGVAREQARKDLPLSTYTEVYWKIDLHNLLHFMWLREDPHAQQEIREVAGAIAKIVAAWVPACYQAFVDYKQEAIHFSKQEAGALGDWLPGDALLDVCFTDEEIRKRWLVSFGLTSKSERIAFVQKFKRLMGVDDE